MKLSQVAFNVGCALLSMCIFTQVVQSKKLTEITAENCEVCVKFIQRFDDSLDDATRSTPAKIESALLAMCKKAKKDDNRFCYYIGGTEDSATSIISEVTKPLSYHLPAEKICKKLYKKDEQICDLKYDKELDLTNVNLKALKVKDLKKILGDWEEQCRGCTEKSDYVARVEELLPVHSPEVAAARAKMEL